MKYFLLGIFIGVFIYYLAYFVAAKFNIKNKKQKIDEEIAQYKKSRQKSYDDYVSFLQEKGNTLYHEVNLLEEQKTEGIKEITKLYEDLSATKDEFKKLQSDKECFLEEMQNELNSVSTRIDSALETEKKIAELKRQEQEEQANLDYYKLQIPAIAINDMKVLRSIENFISSKSELNKIIWKLAYEKPFKELCSRILKPGMSCGIYKITNQDNGKIYIGQSVSIQDRMKSHIKSGIGIDDKKSLLYDDMRKTDLTNFTFEVVEYCKREELDEKEKFWIKYTSSNIFGYNSTVGGSKGE